MPAKYRLSDRVIASLEPAKPGKRYTVWDKGCDRLGVRVTERGVKSFIVLKRLPQSGRPVVHVIGRHPAVSLKAAREKVPGILSDLAQGITPKAKAAQLKRDQALRDADTFDVAVERYVAFEKAKGLRTWSATEAILRREFLGQRPKAKRVVTVMHDGQRAQAWQTAWSDGPDPIWRGRPVSKIARTDIRERLDEIARRNKFAARHALGAVRRLFGWAEEGERYGIVESPAARIRDKMFGITGKDLRRNRVLSDDELRSVWAAAHDTPYPFGPLVKLLLLTGQRLSDIAEASWPEIAQERDVLTIPPGRFKTGVAQEVPLGPAAVAILGSLPTFAGDYIFTTTGGQRPLNAFHPPKQALGAKVDEQRKKAGLPKMAHWVLHDLRRTVRTRLTSECNVDAFIAERVIGHLLPGLHRVYDQGAHRAQKRVALMAWEAHLLAVVEPGQPQGGNVVRLRA